VVLTDNVLFEGGAGETIRRRLLQNLLDDPDLLPPPEEVAAEIVESLETALERFRRVANALGKAS
jgi:type I restriction-modification system DNA methylase subunit